jgi:hypothetical protein
MCNQEQYRAVVGLYGAARFVAPVQLSVIDSNGDSMVESVGFDAPIATDGEQVAAISRTGRG